MPKLNDKVSPLGYAPQCRNLFLIEAFNPYELLNRLTANIREILGMKIFLPENLRIVIEPRRSFTKVGFARGSYDPIERVITLYDNDWCRKTFIHELFHAISAFSRIPELQKVAGSERDFVEGLTEFFTGCILFMKYRECYNAWIESRYPVCAISYEENVRLFGATAQVLVSVSDFVKIYVYNPNVDWFEQYKKFLDSYNIDDFLINKPKKRVLPFYTLFVNMVVRALRRKACKKLVDEFMDLLYEAPISEVLNYSKMLV